MWEKRLIEGSAACGVMLDPTVAARLLRYLDELLKWNQKVNLTAVRDRTEALELHLIDSLAVLGDLGPGATLLDLGAGGGLPGIPLKLVRPELEVTLVDAVAKKVGFLKAAGATLGLKGFKAIHARAEGAPEKEGLPRADIVISRAFMDLPDWVPLGSKYVAEQGRLVAMLGQAPKDPEALGATHGFSKVTVRGYALPYSKATRHVAVFER